MRSFLATAVCLTLISSTIARVADPHSFRDLQQRDVLQTQRKEIHHKVHKQDNRVVRWFKNLFARVDDTTCYQDDFYDFVGSQEAFCQLFMEYPNATYTLDFTPTSTFTDVYSTQVQTRTSLARVTPTTTRTVTTTVNAAQQATKRDAAPQITGRGLSNSHFERAAAEFNRRYRREDAENTTAFSVSFSSACSCQQFGGSTVTVTYTNEPTVATLSGFVRTITTVESTQTAAALVVTQTTTVSSGSTSSSTSSQTASTSISSEAAASDDGSQTPPSATESEASASLGESQTASATSAPTPTSGAFTCPDDNNSTVSEMVGNQRYDYVILCDTVLMDQDLGGTSFTYDTFQECVGACSIADSNFNDPVCQGVSFYAGENGTSVGNCFLKQSAARFVAAPGVDTAWLKTVEVGISPNSSATTTESAPFAGGTATLDSTDVESSMATMFANSTNVMPMVTPPASLIASGMLVDPQFTAYSTFVSDGSTYSTGTGYSTEYTSNGVYYSAYYSTWSAAWTHTTAVYGEGEGGSAIQNSTNSQTSQTTGTDDNTYKTTVTNTTTFTPGGYNVTEVIETLTIAPNGTEINSTAVTSYFSVQTAMAGGANNTTAGSPASATAFTSAYSTLLVETGGTNGVYSTLISSAITPSPTAVIFASTTVNSFGSAGSTGIFISGLIASSQISGAGSGIASGVPGSASTLPVSAIVVSNGISGGNSGIVSSVPSSSPSGILISSTVLSGQTQGATSGIVSGVVTSTILSSGSPVSYVVVSTGIGSAISGIISGAVSSTGTLPATPVSVVTVSEVTHGATSGIISGGITSTGTSPATPVSIIVNSSGIGSAVSGIISGVVSSSGTSPATPLSIIVSSGGTQGASSGILSIVPSGTSGATSAITSSVPSSSPTSTDTFTNSNGNRFGTGSTTTTSSPGTAPLSSGTAPTLPSSGMYTAQTAPASTNQTSPSTAPGTAPPSSSSGTFTNTNGNRSPFFPLGSSTTISSSPTGTFTNTGDNRSPYPSMPSSSTGSFTNTGDNRSPYPSSPSTMSGTAPLSTPSASIPFLTNTSGGYSPPGLTEVANTTIPITTGPLSTGPAPLTTPMNSTTSAPSGTLPIASMSTTSQGFSNTNAPRYPCPPGATDCTSTAPGTAPPSNSTAPASTGTAPPSNSTISTGTAPPSNSTAAPPTGYPPIPNFHGGPNSNYIILPPPSSTSAPPMVTSQATCANGTMATMFVTTTFTVMGCDSTCVPNHSASGYGGYGGYGSGPQSFGLGGILWPTSTDPATTTGS